MSHKLKITAVSGGAGQPSRTLTIIEEIIKRLDKQIPIELHLIQLLTVRLILHPVHEIRANYSTFP